MASLPLSLLPKGRLKAFAGSHSHTEKENLLLFYTGERGEGRKKWEEKKGWGNTNKPQCKQVFSGPSLLPAAATYLLLLLSHSSSPFLLPSHSPHGWEEMEGQNGWCGRERGAPFILTGKRNFISGGKEII